MSGTTRETNPYIAAMEDRHDALQAVNVNELMTQINSFTKQALDSATLEVNDVTTRASLVNALRDYLDELTFKRVFGYSVICDESNNSPARIDNNELHVDIVLTFPTPIRAVQLNITLASRSEETHNVTEDLGHQLEAWVSSRGSDLHRAWDPMGQPVSLGLGWQQTNGDREVPTLAGRSS